MLKKGNDHFEVTQARAQGQCLREALRVRRAVAAAGRALSFSACRQVPGVRGAGRDRQPGARQGAQGRDPDRRSEPPQHRDRSDQDQRRRRHASGVRRSREEEPDRRRAAGTELPGVDGARNHSGHGAAAAHPRACQCAGGCRHRPDASYPGRGRADRQMAIAETKPAVQPAAKSSSSTLFGSLFASKSAEAKTERATARSIAWRGWWACAAATPTPRPWKPPPAPKPKPRGQADQRGFAWRDPRRGRPRPKPIKTTEAQAPAPRLPLRLPHRAPAVAGAGQYGDERRRARWCKPATSTAAGRVSAKRSRHHETKIAGHCARRFRFARLMHASA